MSGTPPPGDHASKDEYVCSIEAFGGEESWFRTPDGLEIRYARWRARPSCAGTVVLLHGRTEFIEKYHETVGDQRQRGFEVWSMDWRGQGLSTRELRNRHKGYVRSFEYYVRDLSQFMELVEKTAPEPRIGLAHSMGGHILLRFLRDHPSTFEKVVLTAPMIDLPLKGVRRIAAQLAAEAVCALGLGGVYVPSVGGFDLDKVEFEGNNLTSDRMRFERCNALIAANPYLALGGVTWGWLKAALRSIALGHRRAAGARHEIPVHIAAAMDDTVVSNIAISEFCNQSSCRTMDIIANSRHEILMEIGQSRDKYWQIFDDYVSSSARI